MSKRYQIYLDQSDVEVVDDFASALGKNRSELLREIIEKASNEYKKILTHISKDKLKTSSLMQMAAIDEENVENAADDVDEIYREHK